MSEAEFANLRETLELLSIPGFRKSIAASVKQMKNGNVVSLEEAFKEGK